MILQIATGIFLTFYYAPSTATAWESTDYLIKHVPAGGFVLSLHYWGASAMIAFMAMHLLQVLLWGAYKKPRELQWIVGVLLFIITLVLGLTGYLLPWDLNALLASKVAIQIAGSAPIVGKAVLALPARRHRHRHADDQPLLRHPRVADAGAADRAGRRAPRDLPLERPGRTADRRSAQAQAGPLLAGPDVHGHRALVRDVRDHRRARDVLAGAARRQGRSEQHAASSRIRPGISSRSTRCSTSSASSRRRSCRSRRCSRRSSCRRCSIVLLIVLPFIDRNPSRRLSRRPVGARAHRADRWSRAIGLSFFGQYNVVEGQVAHGLVGATAGNAADDRPTRRRKSRPTGGNRRRPAARSSAAPATPGRGGRRRDRVHARTARAATAPTARARPASFPPLAQQPDRHRRQESRHQRPAQRPQRKVPVKSAARVQRHDAGLEGHAHEQADRRRVTYIRNAWGNKADAVTEADVAAGGK